MKPNYLTMKEFSDKRKGYQKKNQTLSLVEGILDAIQVEILSSSKKLINKSEIIDYALYVLQREMNENDSMTFFYDDEVVKGPISKKYKNKSNCSSIDDDYKNYEGKTQQEINEECGF